MATDPRRDLAAALMERARRARGQRLKYYRPYPKQRDFHAAGAMYRERLLSAGNQSGKTLCASYETAMHLSGQYPDWWTGKRFDRPVNGLAASVSADLTRDGVQRLLLGRPGVSDEAGTGSIPRDCIVETRPRTGVPNALAHVTVQHVSGGNSTLKLMSYEQGREKFQADTLDFVWLDEEPPYDIYTEALTRTNTTLGPVYLTFTPLKGASNTVRRFTQEKPQGTTVIFMTLFDALHYTPEQAQAIIDSYPAHEREARAFGKPVLGRGAVYPFVQSALSVPAFSLPDSWPRICGMDLGWTHPTCAVWLAHDRDTDIVYVYDVYAQSEVVPAVHASAIKSRGDWIPVTWPHDAMQAQKDTGLPLRDTYRAEGVSMLMERAQFEDGSIGVEAGIQMIANRMQKGQFKVFEHLERWWQEYREYHRNESGVIVKERDDVMDATRYAMMSLRFARPRAASADFHHKRYRESWRV